MDASELFLLNHYKKIANHQKKIIEHLEEELKIVTNEREAYEQQLYSQELHTKFKDEFPVPRRANGRRYKFTISRLRRVREIAKRKRDRIGYCLQKRAYRSQGVEIFAYRSIDESNGELP